MCLCLGRADLRQPPPVGRAAGSCGGDGSRAANRPGAMRAGIAQPVPRCPLGAPRSLLGKARLFWFGASPALGLLQVAGLSQRSELSPATETAGQVLGQDSEGHSWRCNVGANGIGKSFGIGRYVVAG